MFRSSILTQLRFNLFVIDMEVVRSVWKKPVLLYKIGLRASLRNRYITKACSSTSKIPKKDFPLRHNDVQLTNSDVTIVGENDATFNALVSTEELLAQIGLAREFATDSKVEHPYVDKLKRVQMILFDLSHAISKPIPGKSKSFESKHINDLEEWIAEYANQLPPQETYIIPGGGKACSMLHSAKAVCKRVERNVASLVEDGLLNKEAQIYLNKLQSFLLTTSRIAAKCDQRTENIYIPRVEVEKNEEK
ncbi:cob(I)yrinic acid a,c-diamide adenosyltransferase, mitochondrial-like isoform X2 [Ceratina calcarata]|uniref:Cob(I)yrinic acid a,c-diamide adenosyltransferase, mitochondrial-like isoform X2 n=1 Tax=Ceratina calcarata TaxID=156304 RepID=A0AAJ7WHA5_9HYME|nr:cob(I)yrinic acid a,c-diamide adenosyltransferase, mitochondrial-like isoform X2 [Ceratina calcarata]